MLSGKMLHDSSMTQMLNVVVDNFARQGVVCEIASPSKLSFSSTLPESTVREILAGCSLPLSVSFEQAQSGCRGSAEVQGLQRADE